MDRRQQQTIIPEIGLYSENGRQRIFKFFRNFKRVLLLFLQQFRCWGQVLVLLLQQFRRHGRVFLLALQAIRGRIPERVTMFPNLTANRVCKFFVNRYLGKFIRIMMDLDGLEIQLGVWKIQLNGVALNTDFLSRHLSMTPVNVKEGFIGCITIKIPWKLVVAASEKFEINLEDVVLVLVLVPRSRTRTEVETSSNTTEECSVPEVHSKHVEGATDLGGTQGLLKKIVERLLLGLHVKIKNLIVAFEQRTDNYGTNLGIESSCQYQSILALRVLQTQFSGVYHDNAALTNFINFQAATLDLHDVIEKDAQPGIFRPLKVSGSGQPGKSPVTVPVIQGNGGGCSGSVQLTISRKNCSVEIPKVDVKIHLDPVKLQLQLCTIQRLISLVHSIVECGEKGSEPSLCSNNWQSPVILSRQERIECNLNANLDGVSVILEFEDHGHANLVSTLESSRFESLQQDTGCLDAGKDYLEANFDDLRFYVQVSAQEARFKTMVKHMEIFEYRFDKLPSLSKLEECSEGNMFSIGHLQKKVEEALPPFPVSLHTAEAVENIKDEVLPHDFIADKRWKKIEISTASTSKKFVKIKLLASEYDCDHNFSVSCHFRNMKCNDYLISCTEFDVQFQPFVLWADIYAAIKLFEFIEGIENPSKKCSEISDKARDGCSFNGRNDVQQRNMQGNVSISHGRIILCFPMEINEYMNPYLLRDNFICMDLSEYASTSKCQQEELLKVNELSLNGTHFPSSNFVNLKMGEGALFLVSPSKTTTVKRISGDLDEMQFSARKVFSISNVKERDYSVIGFRWQENSRIVMRKAEREWEEANENLGRVRGSRRVSGNNSEFPDASTAGALEVTGSDVKEKIIQNSDLFIQFCLPHAQLDIYGSEHIQIANLLSLLTNCICFNGYKETCLKLEGKPMKKNSHSKVSQSLILIECKFVDIAIHLAETVNMKVFRKVSLERELPGSWSSFRLSVRNLEVMSVSNLGGVPGASYFTLIHEEGLLYGSLINKMENPQSAAAVRELCLLTCKSNVFGRGDGEGNNGLAIGNAGTTITHLVNPQDLESLTTVTVRCCTLVAPGGRVDYLPSIISFFNRQSSTAENQIANPDPQAGQGNSYSTSISVELLDIAVSYEPFLKGSRVSSARNLVEDACAPVGCILAAAAVSLSRKTQPKAENKKYTISLEDVGLLVLDLSKASNDKPVYDANSLRSTGYVKVAGVPIMNMEVELNPQDKLLWEVNCTKSHIWLVTCHDTTAALTLLIEQLQYVFQPDYEEFVVHLQRRRNTWKNVSPNSSRRIYEVTRSFIILPAGRISLKNFRVTWKICAGSDWPDWKNYNSIPMQVKPRRNAACSQFEVDLHGVNAQYDTFPDGGGLYASKLALSIEDLRMFDISGQRPRKTVLWNSSANALMLELDAVITDPSSPLEEYWLRLKLLPLRLNLEQRQLEFLVEFFSEKLYSRESSAEDELRYSFIRKCKVYPLTIRLDYVPDQVDWVALVKGKFGELAKLIPYRAIDLHLKDLEIGGIFGYSTVSKIVIGKWKEDILHRILPSFVGSALFMFLAINHS